MADPPTTVLAAGVVLAGLGYLGAGFRARGDWATPAGPPFVAMVVANGLVALSLGVLGVAGNVSSDGFFDLLGVFFLLPVAWGVFALAYTGWRRLVTPVGVGAVTAVVTVPVLLSRARDLVGDVESGGPLALVSGFLVLLSLITSSGLCIVGIATMARAAYRRELVSNGHAGALTACGVAPLPALLVTGQAALLFGAVGGYAVLTSTFVVGAAGALLAVERYDALDVTPAAGAVGRSTVVAELDDPMIVVDERERVIDINDAAVGTFDTDRSAAVGDPVEALLGTTFSELYSAEEVELHTAWGNRQFDVSTSAITDEHDRPLGWTILLVDVTAKRSRKQRLEVLNRVLRHNLRNDMNVVEGYAEIVEGYVDGETPSEYLDRIGEKASSLSDLGEEAREVERLMTAPRTTDRTEQLSSVVDRVTRRVREAHPGTSVAVDLETDPDLRLNGTVVEKVLWQLVENAVQHNDGPSQTVAIRSRRTDSRQCPLAITVADDGPGIPTHEWSVVVEGDETDLEHGSGLGLWLMKWGVMRLGGHVALSGSDLGGSAVTVHLPEPIGSAESTAVEVEGDTGRASAGPTDR